MLGVLSIQPPDKAIRVSALLRYHSFERHRFPTDAVCPVVAEGKEDVGARRRGLCYALSPFSPLLVNHDPNSAEGRQLPQACMGFSLPMEQEGKHSLVLLSMRLKIPKTARTRKCKEKKQGREAYVSATIQ